MERGPKPMAILVQRAYLPDESAVLGKLSMPDGWSCYTLENPWRNNERSVSCIPEGLYDMALRESAIVRRTSGGEFTQGWEIEGVPDRTFIMVHPGNWARDTEGCILVGRRFSWHQSNGPMVTRSRDTFRDLMSRMADRADWLIDILVKAPEQTR